MDHVLPRSRVRRLLKRAHDADDPILNVAQPDVIKGMVGECLVAFIRDCLMEALQQRERDPTAGASDKGVLSDKECEKTSK